jgi:hypothetical protein
MALHVLKISNFFQFLPKKFPDHLTHDPSLKALELKKFSIKIKLLVFMYLQKVDPKTLKLVYEPPKTKNIRIPECIKGPVQ